MRPDGVAKGSSRMGNGMPRVVCAFDPESFEQIRQRAIAEGTSFAEQVRTLTEWALESERNGK